MTPVSTMPSSGTDTLEMIMGAAMRHMSLFCGRRVEFKPAPSEGVYPGEFLANDKLVHGFGAFVSDDTFEVQQV